jgi:hypothetical protein
LSIGESSIVVGRGGWLRLPQEYLDRAGIGARAAIESLAESFSDGVVAPFI